MDFTVDHFVSICRYMEADFAYKSEEDKTRSRKQAYYQWRLLVEGTGKTKGWTPEELDWFNKMVYMIPTDEQLGENSHIARYNNPEKYDEIKSGIVDRLVAGYKKANKNDTEIPDLGKRILTIPKV